jgi:hypothetical protein
MRARLRVVDDHLAELFIAPHRILEHRNRTRQCSDLVTPISVGHGHLRAGRDLFGHMGDRGQWFRDRVPDRERSRGSQQHGEGRQQAREQAVSAICRSIWPWMRAAPWA